MLTAIICGQLVLCSLEPSGDGDWHYRTRVGPVADKCWYIGPRMKPRSELYWAETPAIPPPMTKLPPTDDGVWEMLNRWRTK